jgi:hypothetical protein
MQTAARHQRAAVVVSVPEQHLQPLGAAFQVGAVNLRVAARAGPAPGRQVLVTILTLARLRARVACGSLLHLVPSLLGIESLSRKASGSGAGQTFGG